jgi:fructokinase
MVGPDLDVLSIGEALVDFLPNERGRPVHEVETWNRCTGGAVANVAVGLARLGRKIAFAGVVGEDAFGTFLYEQIKKEGVDVSRLRRTAEGKTALAFVSLTQEGERTFAFYRTRAAGLFLDRRDVRPDVLRGARVVHFGTNSLLMTPAQEAMFEMVDAVRAQGGILSCDPNVRLGLWEKPEVLKDLIHRLVPKCSVVKLAEEELEFVFGHREPEGAVRWLRDQGVVLPIVTLGAKGALLLVNGIEVRVPSPKVDVVDTTGAGDGFMAGLLYGLTSRYVNHAALAEADPDTIREWAAFACKVGARVCTKLGAQPALPRLSEVQEDLPRG